MNKVTKWRTYLLISSRNSWTRRSSYRSLRDPQAEQSFGGMMKIYGIETFLEFSSQRQTKHGISGSPGKKGGRIGSIVSHGLAIMRVHSALQRAFPHGQLRKTAAIDLRGPAASRWKERSRWARLSRARYKFIPCVRIYSFRQSIARSVAPPTCVFTILQYRRPEWVKTRVAGPFTGVWKYLQEFQIELTGGDFVVPATGYHSPNRAIAPCQPVCFTPWYIRHEPNIFFPLHFRAGIWHRIKPPFFASISEFPYISRELEPIWKYLWTKKILLMPLSRKATLNFL